MANIKTLGAAIAGVAVVGTIAVNLTANATTVSTTKYISSPTTNGTTSAS